MSRFSDVCDQVLGTTPRLGKKSYWPSSCVKSFPVVQHNSRTGKL